MISINTLPPNVMEKFPLLENLEHEAPLGRRENFDS